MKKLMKPSYLPVVMIIISIIAIVAGCGGGDASTKTRVFPLENDGLRSPSPFASPSVATQNP